MKNNGMAYAVIGANYGDEGKGLITDYLCWKDDVEVVIRANGGAQAGHTVVLPSGERHVFRHIGAGTFAGSTTYLSRFFVCNPLLFATEYEELRKKHYPPSVFVDPNARVTTPYDMLLNQGIEASRGNARHGSCGVGFGETIERCLDPHYALHVRDLDNMVGVRQTLERIRAHYAPRRALDKSASSLFTIEETLDQMEADFIAACHVFNAATIPTQQQFLKGKLVLFEGAQGLLLDQNNKSEFPHVTRSNTGARNTKIMCDEIGIHHIEAFYVTRPYLTRHGPGPLPGEMLGCEGVPEKWLCETNVQNNWQGQLRYAPLDVKHLKTRVLEDALRNGIAMYSIAMTCGDRFDAPLPACGQRTMSFGPTHDDVVEEHV